VNRISMGVQSLDETLLDRLGRIHSRAMVFKSFDLLRRGGFDNVNLDLMFAIPGQTMATWRATLDEALAPGSETLSSYHDIYVHGLRTRNWSNTLLYCEELEKGKRAIESREELPPLRRAGETAAFGLRMNAGWPFAAFHKITGYELGREWEAEINQLVGQGWG